MHTKETFPLSHENTKSYEHSSEGSLRGALLLARTPEKVIIPENTYTLRENSRRISEQTPTEWSSLIKGEWESRFQRYMTGSMEHTFREGESLASLHNAMKLDQVDGKTAANMTVLYDKKPLSYDKKLLSVEDDGEMQIPAAVIVHERLSTEEIQRLREALPEGVPILDGETNALLDDVGRAEREMGQKVDKVFRDLGATAYESFSQSSS